MDGDAVLPGVLSRAGHRSVSLPNRPVRGPEMFGAAHTLRDSVGCATFVVSRTWLKSWEAMNGHAALRTRALSKTNPALPYICRLTVFRRLTCPSTGPLLHRCVTAASTADSSRRMPSANRRISGQEDASPFTSQSLSVPDERLRSRSANSSAKPNAVANSSLLARIASIRLCSLGLRSSGRRTHSNDNCLGDGARWSRWPRRAGTLALLPCCPQSIPDVPLHAIVRAAEISRRQLPVQVGRVRAALGNTGVDPFTMLVPSGAPCPSRLPVRTLFAPQVVPHGVARHAKFPGDSTSRVTLSMTLVDLLEPLDPPPSSRPLGLKSR